MSLGSSELYELFLALTPARVQAARDALQIEDAIERGRALQAALIPLAVDAALLGAEGVSALARAAAGGAGAPRAALVDALDTLDAACVALGQADASGARVDEAALSARAAELREASGSASAPVHSLAPAFAAEDNDDDDAWSPALADDMIAAFLDECVERLDGLAERLILLEQRAADQELIAEIFRDLHTLKGSSAFAGLKKLNRVAHLAEDRVGELRDGTRAADRRLIDLLLETLDVLRQIVERARARQPIDVEVSSLIERLRDPSAVPAAARQPRSAPSASSTGVQSSSASAGGTTLRIEFEKVDQLLNLVGEVVLARGRLTAAAESQGALLRELGALRKKLGVEVGGEGAGRTAALLDDLQRSERVLTETWTEIDAASSALGLASGQLRDTVMKLRMVPISRLFSKYQRTVRELSHALGKQVQVELSGAETELDKVLVERLEDPLLHLVRNAVDHGIEPPATREASGKPASGTLRLAASQRGGQIVVTIEDDGAGIDPERLRAKAVEQGLINAEQARALSDGESLDLIFRAGFSTAARVSDVSGRGVGMDVVRDAIDKLKGTIAIDSQPGRGTRLELRLPLTLAITQVLAARVAGELVAMPLDAVVSAHNVSRAELEPVADGTCLRLAGRLVPVVDLAAVLGLSHKSALAETGEAAVVIAEVGADELGLLVQQVLGRHEVVIKSLGPLLASAPCAAGATLLGERVLLVVDLAEVAARTRDPARALAAAAPLPPAPRSGRGRVLVAEDADVIREVIVRELRAAGFEVTAASDGEEALTLARQHEFDAVSTDVMMPKLDGYELVRALRADPRYQTTPIVMVTGKDARIDALRGYDAGADAYLTKPADVAELIRALDSLLARRARSG